MRNRLLFFAFCALTSAAFAQTAKKPLTHDVYDMWKSVQGSSISRDGAWALAHINPQVGDGRLIVRNLSSDKEMVIERGSGSRFSRDSRYLFTTVVPAKADVDKARKEKKAPKDQPKNELQVHDLQTGTVAKFERLRTVRYAGKDAGWFALQQEEAPKPAATPDEKPAPAKPPLDDSGKEIGQVLDQRGQGGGRRPGAGAGPETPEQAQGASKPTDSPKKKEHAAGAEWTFVRVSDGKQVKVTDVGDFQFSEDGTSILYTVSSKDGKSDGLYWLNLETQQKTSLMEGLAQYRNMSVHQDSGKVVFLSDKENYKTDPTDWGIYVWTPGQPSAKLVLKNGSTGIGPNNVISTRGGVRFSEDGKRVLFSVQPKSDPAPATPDETPEEEKATLDVWSHNDKMLMSQQLIRLTQLQNVSYACVLDLSSQKAIQLEDEALTSVNVGDRGNARYALGIDSMTYALGADWGADANVIYVVDTQTGVRKKIFDKVIWNPSQTVDGRYMVWFDSSADDYFSYEYATGRVSNFTQQIPHTLIDVDDDHPGPRPPTGPAQMTADGRVIISDGYDLWLCDALGSQKPMCVTDGVGRLRNWQFEIQPMPKEDADPGIDTTGKLYLRVTDEEDYDTGYFVDTWTPNNLPQKIIMGPKNYVISAISMNSDKILFTQSDFVEFPDVWASDLTFANPKRITNANPQQSDYIWGKSEMVHWNSTDGKPLKGVLIKPENFDPSKKYPMIVYFYEISSNEVNSHRVPSPSASTINPTMFASNGYLVFMPDIVYEVGFPGEGAEKCVLPGVSMLLDRGYVDAKRIGCQGQSWGGYQVMHLISRTNMFAAAGAGAAVSNMFSAYGGIREGSGLVRQFQYEVGQSRIGASIWEKPLLYIENSPLFWADKVNTPVLMMNNDRDDAVPYSQGVEMFTALRRNGKVVWMLNYNGDRHNLTRRANRKDLSIRLHQFFDHYLKGAPMPQWMAEGLPATKKGKDYGYAIPTPKP